MTNRIIFGESLDVLRSMESESVNLIYIDPPFNSGKMQARTTLKTRHDKNGERTGFAGRRYATKVLGKKAYSDAMERIPSMAPGLAGAEKAAPRSQPLPFYLAHLREAI